MVKTVIKESMCIVAMGIWERSWSFNDDTVRNVITFGVDESSSSHTDNLKNDFSVLGVGDNFDINGSFGETEIK